MNYKINFVILVPGSQNRLTSSCSDKVKVIRFKQYYRKKDFNPTGLFYKKGDMIKSNDVSSCCPYNFEK